MGGEPQGPPNVTRGRDGAKIARRPRPTQEDGRESQVLLALEEITEAARRREYRLSEPFPVGSVDRHPERACEGRDADRESDREMGSSAMISQQYGGVSQSQDGEPAQMAVEVLTDARGVERRHGPRA